MEYSSLILKAVEVRTIKDGYNSSLRFGYGGVKNHGASRMVPTIVLDMIGIELIQKIWLMLRSGQQP